MQAVLYSKTGEFSGTSFKITGDVTIGKSNNNNIQFRANIVSGSHAKITYDDELKAFYLEDLGSSNGTQLDGVRVTGKEKLDRLHIITFAGKFDFVFQVEGTVPQKTEPSQAKPPKPDSSATTEQKTAMEQGAQGLPSFSKKEEPAGQKTVVDSGQGTPAGLPSFGKKSEEVDVKKTMIEGGQGAPAPLPAFEKSKEPKQDEQQKTMMEKPSNSALPKFEQKPEPRTPTSEQETEVMETVKPTEPPDQPESKPTSNVRFKLQVEKLDKEFDLKDGANTIGRVFGSDIIIDDNSLSRKHASIIVTGDKITITDLGSRNGTFVNKSRIDSETDLTTDSAIKLGLVEMKIKKVN